MPDAIFEDPRLAAVYDPLDPDRSDLDVYLAITREFGAAHVLDIGCGTGTFAVLLADAGLAVVAVDPAGSSLDVARGKPAADHVTWIQGTARDLPALTVDLVTMTANVAQAIVDEDEWNATLAAAYGALRAGGRLVFETRVPARRAWEEWTRERTHDVTDIPGIGTVESWVDLVTVDLPLVSLRGTYLFASDGATLTSDSTLRFREQDEVEADLQRSGFVVDDVRDAPDRPGREYVFVARRAQ
jgi:SAM-dependent methyltransferase